MEISNLVNLNSNQNLFLNNKPNMKANLVHAKNPNENSADVKKTDDGTASKITLAKQGQAGYLKSMDLDEDGTLTLEEFNKYCQENSIDDTVKQKMLQMMNTTSSSTQVLQRMEEEAKKAEKERIEALEEDDDDEEFFSGVRDVEAKEDSTIFAKKGEVQYDESMDINSDGKVTYKEYADYCERNLGKAKPLFEGGEVSKETRVAVESYKTFEPSEVELEESFYEEVV